VRLWGGAGVCAVGGRGARGGPGSGTAIRAALNRTGFGLLCIDIRYSLRYSIVGGCTGGSDYGGRWSG